MSEESTTRVQLGCGTLIIIALIVIIFSGGDDAREVREELEGVSRKLDRIEKKLDELSQNVGRLTAPEPLERK